MLDTETKRRIDTARDILVGKVPDPKSQVEQITIALIYKFMDDMDAEVEELGGDRTFFADSFAKFGWGRLMSPSVGGHKLLSLYSEGISTMPQNAGIPALFRDIFKNAYLPYRDPETLKSFLKVIDGFTYDHSERLGDAFEYLLSVLGSQGDAGQFRTPRHIIDFIVEILRPQKGDVILDPACGTAGFLISAYKHILRSNLDALGNSTLTPDEKGRMATNFKGYDISPDMVRLSLVNLYLHGFKSPQISEYDTLTSEDKWNEFADVILANPPFMSPKGGIKPHKRFSIKAKRSEVLFVDYMAEHLSPRGRAGIIVPEGIIFQSQTAYKDLRKMLVENSLVAVISLPAGVFNPYSGVKTSILILDKSLAKKTDKIAFFKVENDGFGLGAQRRAVEGDDLPFVLEQITNYELRITRGEELITSEDDRVLIVPKSRIAANGDYNLSGERYKEGNVINNSFPIVELGEVCKIKGGYAFSSSNFVEEGTQLIRMGNVKRMFFDYQNSPAFLPDSFKDEYQNYLLKKGDILVSMTGTIGKEDYGNVCMIDIEGDFLLNQRVGKFEVDTLRLDSNFIYYIAQSKHFRVSLFSNSSGGVRQANISNKGIENIKIPLPPIAIQKEIVTEIEGYQKVINGARAVIDNYRPHIAIDPDWEMVLIGDIVDFVSGLTVSIPEVESENGTPIIAINNVTEDGHLTLKGLRRIDPPTKSLRYVQKGDLLFNWRNGSKHLVGKTALFDLEGEYLFASFLIGIRCRPEFVNYRYLWHTLNIYRREGKYIQFMRQNVNGLFNREELKITAIPLPPLETQQAIVAEIEAEQALVNANRELIERFEKKIQTVLNRIWGGE